MPSLFNVAFEVPLLVFFQTSSFRTNPTTSLKFNFRLPRELVIVLTRHSQPSDNDDMRNSDLTFSLNLMPIKHNWFITVLKLIGCSTTRLPLTIFILNNLIKNTMLAMFKKTILGCALRRGGADFSLAQCVTRYKHEVFAPALSYVRVLGYALKGILGLVI